MEIIDQGIISYDKEYKMFTFETEDSTTRLSISLMTVGFYTIKMITITAQNFQTMDFPPITAIGIEMLTGIATIMLLITENGNGMSHKIWLTSQ